MHEPMRADMVQARRQLAEPERSQFLAQGLLGGRHPEFAPEPHQVDDAPAHHA